MAITGDAPPPDPGVIDLRAPTGASDGERGRAAVIGPPR